MRYLLSFVDSVEANKEYSSSLELENFLKNNKLDGLEVIRCGGSDIVKPKMAIGNHLPFFNFWMDYYNKNDKRVISEFGNLDFAKSFYQYEPEELYKYFLNDLEYVNKYCEYGVFHVADVSNLEYLNRNHFYTDEEVINCAIEIINKMLEKSVFNKLILFENLYIPGLQFNSTQVTKKFMDSINYDKKGFMLDIGHLMNTNPNIKTEDEGWEYVESVIDKFEDMKEYFKGVHLHVSISGEIIKKLEKNPPKLPEDFYKRLEKIYEYVGEIDQHKVAKSKLAKKVLEKISPEYVVLEFRSFSKKDREEKVRKQMKILI